MLSSRVAWSLRVALPHWSRHYQTLRSVHSMPIRVWQTYTSKLNRRHFTTGFVVSSAVVLTGHMAIRAHADPKITIDKKSDSERSLKEALVELNEAIDELMKKMQVALPELTSMSPLWLLGLNALATEQMQEKRSWNKVPEDYALNTAHTMRRYGAVAHAIYEDSPEAFWAFLRETAAPYFSRENFQFVTYSSLSDRESPAYALLVDHSNKEILVCIRGTKTVHDLLTDIGMETAPFLNDYAHGSIVRATQNTYAKLGPQIHDSCRENPEYSVVCVGHSLGASVAVLLTFLLRENGVESASAVSLAAPACLSPTLALSSAEFTHAVVHGDDIIPRSSMLALLRLIKDIHHLAIQQEGKIHEQAWDQLDTAFNNLTEYEWFRATMRNFLQGEEVTLQGALDVVKTTKSQLEQQVQETVEGFTLVANQIGQDVQDQVSTLSEKYNDRVNELTKLATDVQAIVSTALNDAIQQLNSISQENIEQQKSEVQRWLQQLGGESPTPKTEQVAALPPPSSSGTSSVSVASKSSEEESAAAPLDQRPLNTPARILYLWRDGEITADTSVLEYALCSANPRDFDGIIVSPNMLHDHSIASYNKALDMIIEEAQKRAPQQRPHSSTEEPTDTNSKPL